MRILKKITQQGVPLKTNKKCLTGMLKMTKLRILVKIFHLKMLLSELLPNVGLVSYSYCVTLFFFIFFWLAKLNSEYMSTWINYAYE